MENHNLKFTYDAIKVVKEIGHIHYSSIQAVKTILIEKDGEMYISIQKWWRKTAQEP